MPITIDIEEIASVMRDLAKVQNQWTKFAKPAVGGQAAKFVKRIKERRLSGRPGLKARTGALRRAVGFNVKSDVSSITANVGLLKIGGITRRGAADVLQYGRIHEFGGTIRAKRAKYLTIPLPAAKTRAGVTKFTAREAKRIYSETFVFKSKAGNLIIAGKAKLTRGKGAIVPLFVLKKQVTIPKRPWLQPELPLFLFAVQKLLERKLADVLAGKT